MKKLRPTFRLRSHLSNCPKSRSNSQKEPRLTEAMKKKKMTYIWKQLDKNTNLSCWIPVEKKDIPITELTEGDINVQDVPNIPSDVPDVPEEILLQHVKEAEQNKEKASKKKLKNVKDEKELVSVDDPKKYKIVEKFIRKKGLKVYGGVAINAHLPKEEKIYTSTEVPDYDVFSPNPWQDAVELAREFVRQGYKYVEVRAGIHKGTYKVIVNLWPAADISFMPKEEYDRIGVLKQNGMNFVNATKLLESMYKEFSEPWANPSRWPKVNARERLLQKYIKPLEKKYNCSETLFSIRQISEPLLSLLEITYDFILRKKLLIAGTAAYNIYLQAGESEKRASFSHYKILSRDAREYTDELFAKLMRKNSALNVTTRYYPSRELNNTTYTIFFKHEPICELVHLTSCTPFHTVLDKKVVGIDYIKYDLYDTAVFAETKQARDDAMCMVQYITKVQNAYYKKYNKKETDPSPFQRFITQCEGPFYDSRKVSVLEKMQKRLKEKEKTIREWTPLYKIRKIPYEEPAEECKGKDEKNCAYPCAWNYERELCTTPPGVLRLGEKEEEWE